MFKNVGMSTNLCAKGVKRLDVSSKESAVLYRTVMIAIGLMMKTRSFVSEIRVGSKRHLRVDLANDGRC